MWRKLTATILCACMLAATAPLNVMAENTGDCKIPEDYSNEIDSCLPEVFGSRRTSFLGKLPDGSFQTVICHDGKLYVNTFDSDYRVKTAKELDLELPVWGGVFLGESYNYVICGNSYNAGMENGGEVYRIIQYDKNFNRINSLSLYSKQTYTAVPFDSGNVSMDENGNFLTVYTSRLRLDGHQSNIAICIDTRDMSIADEDGMTSFPEMHVSHSFRQIFRYDGVNPVYADLSDAYPERAIYIQYQNMGASLMDISGEDGYNETNAELSGLEISDTNYLAVGTYLHNGVNNVFLSCIDKSSGVVCRKWLTENNMFQPVYKYWPEITKVRDDRYVVMWETLDCKGKHTDYVVVDGKGNIVSGLKEQNGVVLTDCEPIYDNNRVIWISAKDGVISFYEIADFSENGKYDPEEIITKTADAWKGMADTKWYDESASEYSIATAEQLAGLSELAADGVNFEGKTINLIADIFLNDESYKYEWMPIAVGENTFNGVFNGNNHIIYNMSVSSDAGGGLFGHVGEKGIVKAVNISQGILYSGGCIADANEGIISFCNNYSCVGGKDMDIGGICNYNSNLVYGCKNYGVVWGGTVAGIVGNSCKTLSVVSQCSNEGLVEGLDCAAGIAAYNYGWLYNCYNKGIVADTFSGGGLNRADELAGIVYRNDSCAVENCYSVGFFSYAGDKRRLDAIACENGGDISNCYVSSDNNYIWNRYADVLSYKEMISPDFVKKLDVQTHSVLSAWMEDAGGMNGGLPITVADYNYANGKYKIQPEAWILSGEKNITVALRDGGDAFEFKCYYNEAEPAVMVEPDGIAEITYANEKVYIKPIKAGDAKIKIHFYETENNVSADYQLNLTVVVDSGDGGNFTGWNIENGEWYWYEDGIKQGTEGRGKEIYDRDTDAWYWLDAVEGGKKAIDKDVYQESYAGIFADRSDGTGKWVRYDAFGHMVKGWDEKDGNTYYFDQQTGAMYKGYASIHGIEQYFNVTTGIWERSLGEVPENGWKNIDGADYWYEDYQRQGYSTRQDYRGKEIYDPQSDAWYWLDNVDNGKKAVSKDVYQESEAGPWADREDGTGKWVRYDENGHMIKGWNTTDAGTYYFDLVYGTMAKGNVTIGGMNYYFDENTGVLIQ